MVIKIYDVNGNQIDEIKIFELSSSKGSLLTYNTTRLLNGLYVIRFQTGDKTISKSFIIFR